MKKLSESHIKNQIERVEYQRLEGTTLTTCYLHLRNGHIVTGTSACLNAKDFSYEIGKKIAYEQAAGKIWELEGYAARCAERTEMLRGIPIAFPVVIKNDKVTKEGLDDLKNIYGLSSGDILEALSFYEERTGKNIELVDDVS